MTMHHTSTTPASAEPRSANLGSGDWSSSDQGANGCVCPVCGGRTIEIRGKAQCSRCHTICETCCEGGRQ
ncbi:MAG: hypothetical protein EA381_17775 [Planctomycetaceae bacterium]|nr:MAG: hypothetical protein EA381_17775 [Planctomycetaceae bacterium]